MISVRLVVSEKYIYRFFGIIKMQDELTRYGIQINRDSIKPDMMLIERKVAHQMYFRNNIVPSEPMIVYDRNDSASIISDGARTDLQRKNVVGWGKDTSFKDVKYHNMEVVDGKYHQGLISPENRTLSSIALTEQDLSKISPIIPLHVLPRYDSIMNTESTPMHTRQIDIMFAGAFWKNYPHVNKHRSLCADKLFQQKGLNTLIGFGRVLSFESYVKALHNTKIFVSPYGIGEFSWKDFEAIFAGCVVIKPNARHVAILQFDIYNDVNMVFCRPDFSDLNQKIDEVLSSVRIFSKMAANSRKRLMNSVADREGRAREFARFLHSCYARSRL